MKVITAAGEVIPIVRPNNQTVAGISIAEYGIVV
jgi:hypothetical protein